MHALSDGTTGTMHILNGYPAWIERCEHCGQDFQNSVETVWVWDEQPEFSHLPKAVRIAQHQAECRHVPYVAGDLGWEAAEIALQVQRGEVA